MNLKNRLRDNADNEECLDDLPMAGLLREAANTIEQQESDIAKNRGRLLRLAKQSRVLEGPPITTGTFIFL